MARAASANIAEGGSQVAPILTQARDSTFRLDHSVDTAGTHLLGWIEFPPACMVGRFGRSGLIRRGPCSAQWPFVSTRDEVFTLYEYGSTSASQRGLLHPDDFWALSVPRELSIGGHRNTDLAGFKRWLLEQVEEFQRTGQRALDVPEEFGRMYVLEHLTELSPEERIKGIPLETLECLLDRARKSQ
jgi:hypothetical protein